MKKIGLIIISAILLASGVTYYRTHHATEAVLPVPQTHDDFHPSPSPSPASLPLELNLKVPFTTQAPKVNWDADHEEFCEEATILMATAYEKNFSLSDVNFADQELYKIKDLEMQSLGYFKDTTVAETVMILKKYSGLEKVEVINNPTALQIKQSLASGKVIIAPFAGRELGNPNFTGEGPLYHMLIIKGYTKDNKIITNDPGTRKGADYLYDTQTILDALHDWNGGDVDHGQKVMIVVG